MKCQLTLKGKITVQKHPKKFKTWLVNDLDKEVGSLTHRTRENGEQVE